MIHSYADTIFEKLVKRLGFEEIPDFDPEVDPTKSSKLTTWNMDAKVVNEYEELYKNLKSATLKKKQKSENEKLEFKSKKIKSE